MRVLRCLQVPLLLVGMLLVTPIASVPAQEASKQSAIIQVDGLSCPFCTYGLEKHLKKVVGVEGVDINMKSGEAIVRLRSGAQVDDAALRQAVKKAGFTARGITRQ